MLKNLDKTIEYFDNLKTKREKWNSVWKDIRQYICPQTEQKDLVFDSTSVWAREQLASGMQSLLVNPSLEWFKIRTMDKDLQEEGEVKAWASDVEKKIFDVFNYAGSNFYNQIHEFFLTLAAFGTSIFYVEEDINIPYGLFFRNIALDECYFEENRFGFVDSLYRLFKLPIKIAAVKWPDCKELVEMLEKNPDERVEILHVVSPSEDKKGVFSYTSDYIYFETRKLLSSGGYSYFPFLVTRWIKGETEPYGYSPGHYVLPDIKLLNKFKQIDIKLAQKNLEPPLLIPREGYAMPLYTAPGSVNFYRNGMVDKIMPIVGMENPVSSMEQQNQCKEAILKAFYIDIFRMGKNEKEMTATEAQYRIEEQMRMMSPIVGRIETEFLNPLITTVYECLLKYKIIEPLGNEGIDVEYVSPLVRAQKSSAIGSIESILGFFQRSGIVNLFPGIYDNINWDKVFKLFFDLRGAPTNVLRTEEEIEQIRKQRQMMAAQATEAKETQ